MSLSRTQFDALINSLWGRLYHLPADKFLTEGTDIVVWNDLKDTEFIVQESIGKHSILRCDAVLEEKLKNLLHIVDKQKSITFADCVSIWGADNLEYESRGEYCFLYPDDFIPCRVDDFVLRQLTPDDTVALDLMKSACSAEETDEGEVNTTDEIAFGAFEGDKIVACASMYDWRGFADIGVLVHPDYRKRNLGKAVVSITCEALLNTQHILCYRYDVINAGSKRIASSLGFTQYVTAESFKVLNYA